MAVIGWCRSHEYDHPQQESCVDFVSEELVMYQLIQQGEEDEDFTYPDGTTSPESHYVQQTRGY